MSVTKPASPRPANRLRVLPLVTLAVVLSVAVLAGSLLRPDGTSETGHGKLRAGRPELQRMLDDVVTGRDRLAPGATAFVSGPRGTWVGSAGVADVATREAMPPAARMRLQSVSKIYTAALIFQLAQERRLHVGDTVEHWLPGVLPYGRRITIRQLLMMRSGIVDLADLMRDSARYLDRVHDRKLRSQLNAIGRRIDTNPAAEVSPLWLIRLAAWQPLLFTPGTQDHYSGIGYELLGLIAARAGAKPLPDLYRERIFKPLGLRQTAYDPQGPISGPHARGYLIGANGTMTDATNWHWLAGAAAGIVSNASETAAFLVDLMRGRLLERRWLEDMRRDIWRSGATSGCAGQAYGWGGAGDAYKTDAFVNADGTRVAVLLLNGRRYDGRDDMAAKRTMTALYCAA
jgi:D-alanyl-D-alanine carboxypeptidase